MTNNNTLRYEFQPPTNMKAIRSTIMQRIIKRNERQEPPLTPPCTKHDLEKNLPYLHLDNGLPSPPIESCTFEDEHELKQKGPSEMVVHALLEMTSPTATLPDSPPSPIICLSKPCSDAESSQVIREKIRLLKEEKHKLFQTMKDLLSHPKKANAPEVTMETETKTHPIERSRSQSREHVLKTRPVIRSRSISHTEFSRTISRYGSYHHERRSPPRFYSNKGYINKQAQSTLLSLSSSTSLNMSRRGLNNNNNNSLYVTSRTQLAARPSSLSSSSSFRPPIRSERHSRY